jgi:hypothetical protein
MAPAFHAVLHLQINGIHQTHGFIRGFHRLNRCGISSWLEFWCLHEFGNLVDRADLIDLIVMFARRCTLTHMTSIRTSDENKDFSVVI